MAQQQVDNYGLPPIIELLSVDSTNNYAFGLLKPDHMTERQNVARHGVAIFAHEQYAGKGQRGKTWVSGKDQNIHLSIILEPTAIKLQSQFKLIALVALAVRSFFEEISNSDITIKWPNDIYFQDRKAGGILIENIITGNEWKWAVAGIGLNINQTGFDGELAKKAVSLKQITGKNFDCLELATELRKKVLTTYDDFVNRGIDVLALYNQFLYKKGEIVSLQTNATTFEALIKEVLPNGQLVVQTDIELQFDFGEVVWVQNKSLN